MAGHVSYHRYTQLEDRCTALEMSEHAPARTFANATEAPTSDIVVTRSTIERLHRHLTLAYMRNPARHIHQAVLIVEHLLNTSPADTDDAMVLSVSSNAYDKDVRER